MNIKLLKKVGLALICVITLASCQTNQTPVKEETKKEETAVPVGQEGRIEFILMNGDEEVSRKELNFKTGEKLGAVMEENMEVVKDDSGFITAIDGISQNPEENKWWTYTANGEMVNVGAYDYDIKPGDRIVFTLSVYEAE